MSTHQVILDKEFQQHETFLLLGDLVIGALEIIFAI